MAATLVTLYVAPFGSWRAYLLVPLALTLVPLLLCELALFFHRRGLWRRAWHWIHDFLTGAFIRVALGIERMRQSKLGLFTLWLAFFNATGLLGYWLWCNVDLLHVVRNLGEMAWTLVTSLRDPVALLESFQALLRSLAAYRALEALREHYVMDMVKMTESGAWSVPFLVLCISAILVIVSVVFYLGATAFPCKTRHDDDKEE